MKSIRVLTAAKTVIRWLRWAAVLALVYYAWGGLAYSAWAGRLRSPLFSSRCSCFISIRSERRPSSRGRDNCATGSPHDSHRSGRGAGSVLFWGHVLARAARGVPGTNYTHFAQEALGAVLGVVDIFWSEKAKGPWQAHDANPWLPGDQSAFSGTIRRYTISDDWKPGPFQETRYVPALLKLVAEGQTELKTVSGRQRREAWTSSKTLRKNQRRVSKFLAVDLDHGIPGSSCRSPCRRR